ncbi:hypothetical protein PTKIN_Ptkin02bG0190500 [Pterospermum kingtungense]
MLWQLFNDFGMVIDIYIPKASECNRDRTTFTFVRYAYHFEMLNAIRFGNNRKIDGFIIGVKEASYGWRARRRRREDSESDRERKLEGQRFDSKLRDHCSYRDVVIGDQSLVDMECRANLQNSALVTYDEMINGDDTDEANLKSVLNYEGSAQQENLYWLECCSVGRVKRVAEVSEIQKGLEEAGFKCNVCPFGGAAVILRFESNMLLQNFLNANQKLYEHWLEDISPWSYSNPYRAIPLWIILEEVPLHLWNVDFFKFLGDSWGSFVCVDYDTKSLVRFDKAKLLVMVDSKIRIPGFITVRNDGRLFNMVVTLEEYLVAEEDASPVVQATLEELPCKEVEESKLGKSFSLSCHKIDLDPIDGYGADFGLGEFSLQLLEEEMTGRCVEDGSNEAAGFSTRVLAVEESRVESDDNFHPSVEEARMSSMYEDGFQRGSVPEHSISDDDIINRNKVIMKESEINFEVGQILGFYYLKSHIQMLEEFEGCDVGAVEGNAGGLISAWREEVFSVQSKIVSQRYIVLIGTLKECDFHCAIVNVYAPNDDRDRAFFWEELQTVVGGCGMPLCILGHLNVVRSSEEKMGATLNQSAMDCFSDFIENLGLIDLPLSGGGSILRAARGIHPLSAGWIVFLWLWIL